MRLKGRRNARRMKRRDVDTAGRLKGLGTASVAGIRAREQHLRRSRCALAGTARRRGPAGGGLSVCLSSDKWECGVPCTEPATRGTAWFQGESKSLGLEM